MKKNKSIAVSFMFLLLSCGSNLVNFKYVEIKDDKYVYSDQVIKMKDIDAIKKVLSYHRIEYKLKDSTFLIPKKVYNDLELMYNYSKKVHDSVWQSKH